MCNFTMHAEDENEYKNEYSKERRADIRPPFPFMAWLQPL